jgi:hypothetical protein
MSAGAHFVHTFCKDFLHTQECKLQKVCIKSANAHFVHTFCMKRAYCLHTLECNSKRQTMFWRNRNVIHIDLNSLP